MAQMGVPIAHQLAMPSNEKRVQYAPRDVQSLLTTAVLSDRGEGMPITEEQVNAAQQAWCDGLVEMGKVHRDGGNVRAVAVRLINDLYDYAEGTVFFKPTLAHGRHTFRDTAKGAL